MTTPEEIEEIHRIRRELKKEFPSIVLKQIDRVQDELNVLRKRVEALIKVFNIIIILKLYFIFILYIGSSR